MSKKPNDGRQLEKIVSLIQKTLINVPDTKLFTNHKVKNTSGREREFDLFIESRINDMLIQIAIECKDYKTAIPVGLIESFHGKCSRIPSINKKVFVSKSGFQKDAINAAKEFGIELFELNKIDKEIILRWFPIAQLGLRCHIKKRTYVLDTIEDVARIDLGHVVEIMLESGELIRIDEFIDYHLLLLKEKLWSMNLLEFMKNGGSKSIGMKTPFTFKINIDFEALIEVERKKKFRLLAIIVDIDSFLIESLPTIVDSQTYGSIDKTSVNRVSIFDEFSKNHLDFIFAKDKFKIYKTNKKGQTDELKCLAKFDSKGGLINE